MFFSGAVVVLFYLMVKFALPNGAPKLLDLNSLLVFSF